MATQQTTTETILPQWYTDYAKNVFGKATAASEMPYQTYGLPRIAGFSPEQEAAFAMAPEKAAGYQPFYNAAGTLAASGATGSSASAAAPYLGAGATMLGAGASGSSLGAANPYFSESSGMARTAGAGSSLESANPYFSPASAYAIQGGNASALGKAAPFFERGTGSFTDAGVAGRYMNPYVQQVLSGIGDMAGRTLREKLLPEVNRTFVGGGTFGGSRSAEFTARAVRDANAAALSQWTQGMKDAYDTGQGQYNEEAGRALSAAGNIGQIAGQDYGRMLDTSGRLADIGQSSGQLSAADYNRMLEAGQTLSNTGQAAGQLAGSDYNRLVDAGKSMADMGSTAGSLSASDYDRMLKGAGAMQDLGTATQGAGLQEAQTLESIGASRQGLAQKSADLAYQDFLAQRDYPWTQLERMTNVAGVPSGTGSTSVTKAPGPSTGAQILGTLGGIAGILGSAGVFKGGGKVQRPVKAGLGWLKDRN